MKFKKSGHLNTSPAFTLVEMLVSISIILIISAILVPALRSVRENSRRIVCLSNLKSIGSAIFIYADENNDWLPNNLDYDHPYTAYNVIYQTSDDKPKPLKLACLYEDDLIDPRVFYCPASDIKYKDYCNPPPWGTLPQMFNEPPDGNGNQWVRTSYYYYPQSKKLDSDGYPEVAEKLSMLNSKKSIVTDNMWSLNVVPHFIGSQRVICALSGDGHAAAYSDTKAFAPKLWYYDLSLPDLDVPENYKTIRPNSREFKEILYMLTE